MNFCQIAAYLNDEGVTSWTGKRFYPELVFGVVKNDRLKSERRVNEMLQHCLLSNPEWAKEVIDPQNMRFRSLAIELINRISLEH